MKCQKKYNVAIVILGIIIITSKFSAAQVNMIVPQNTRLAKTYYNEGIIHLNLGSFNRALANFKISLSNDSLYVPSHAGVQDVFVAMGKADSILAVYDSYIDRYPDNPTYIYLVARLLDPEVAEAEFQRVVAFDSLFYWGHIGLAQTYITLGMFSEAAFHCSTAIAINPVISDAQIVLGIAFENLGELDKAQEQYEKTLFINPKVSPEVYLNLGMLYLEKADTTKSIENLKRFIDFVTHGSEAEFARAQVDSMETALLRASIIKKIKK